MKSIFDQLSSRGYLPKGYTYRDPYITVADIECTETLTDNGTIQAIQKVVSIATSTNLPNQSDMFFCRKSSSAKSAQDMFDEFLNYLRKLSNQLKTLIPIEILSAISDLETTIDGMHKSPQKSHYKYLKNQLEPYLMLNVYFFNGSKYDLKVIAGDIYAYCARNGLNVNPLKKSTAYFSLKFDQINMKDILQFSAPVTLDKFLVNWLGKTFKSIYPYSAFGSIEEIEAQIDFPTKSQFYNQLKQV